MYNKTNNINFFTASIHLRLDRPLKINLSVDKMDQVKQFISEISGRSKSAEEPQKSEKSQADTKDADPVNGMV